MRKLCNIIVILLLITLLAKVPELNAASNKIDWYSHEEAIALGKQEGKKLFLHFYAQWCAYCKKMDKETFSDASVINYLNRHFISSRIDTDKQKRAASEYAVRGVPVTWFISEAGERISSLPGYIAPETLINILKFIHTDSHKRMTYKEFLKTL